MIWLLWIIGSSIILSYTQPRCHLGHVNIFYSSLWMFQKTYMIERMFACVCIYRSVFFMMFFTYSTMAQMFPAGNLSTNLDISSDYPHSLLIVTSFCYKSKRCWRICLTCDIENPFINLCATYRVRNLNLFNLHACTLEQLIKEHAHFQSKKQLVILNIQDIEWTEHFKSYKVNTQEWILITSIV